MSVVKIFYINLLIMLTLAACGGASGGSVQEQPNTKLDVPTTNQYKTNIKLLGDNPIVLEAGEKFIDPSAEAFDFSNQNISSFIKRAPSAIDTSKTGKYTITYSVIDSKGAKVTTKRDVIVNRVVNKDSGVHVNEILASNSSTNIDPDFKQFSDWIELYNYSNNSIDIGGYHISDDSENLFKYTIPANTVIPANGYVIVWADKKNIKKKAIHTNFKLSSKGDSVIFSDKNSNIIDDITFAKQKSDISTSYKNKKLLYYTPTPTIENSTAHSILEKSKKPILSLEDSFYDNPQLLTLSQENGGEIYYTTDGSIPTKNSNKYTTPITIDKTTIIRARALDNGKFLSSVKSRTYLIDEDITLPVVSIGIDNRYLYDDKIGIYVRGTDDNNNPHPLPSDDNNSNNIGWISANFFQDWMRPASIEYIKDKKSQFSENIGLRIFGSGSRLRVQKSLSIHAKDKFGPKSIKYPLFPDKPSIKKVKSFILRNSGSDRTLLMRDATTQALIRDNMDIDYQSYHPTVVFLNGQYWGIMNIREKLNEDYIEANHGIDSDNIDIIGRGNHADEGSNIDYVALKEFVSTHDLTDNQNYQEAISKMDKIEYMNYYITELYIGNRDWPVQNIKHWKEKGNSGKWRCMLYDTDAGYGDMRPYNFNSFEQVLNPNPEGEIAITSPPDSTLLFRSFMSNEKFKNEFLSRFITHINTTFQPNRAKKIVFDLKEPLIPEVGRHFAKWSQEDDRLTDFNYDSWSSAVEYFKNFFTNRGEYLIGHMYNYLHVSGNNSLNIPLSNNGVVEIDGVTLTKDYSGSYFNNAVVTLKAIPNSGYKFVNWSNGETNEQITLNINSDIAIYANFQ